MIELLSQQWKRSEKGTSCCKRLYKITTTNWRMISLFCLWTSLLDSRLVFFLYAFTFCSVLPKRAAVQNASLCPGGLVRFQKCNVKADHTDPKVWKHSRFYSTSSNRGLQAIQCESSINPPWATTCRCSADTEAHRHLFNNELRSDVCVSPACWHSQLEYTRKTLHLETTEIAAEMILHYWDLAGQASANL